MIADRIRDALQRFDIEDVLARNRGALIIGGPGSGKSSLMRHVIEAAADSWQGEDRDAFVPVLVHAWSLLTSLPMNKAIADALRQDLGARLDDIDLDGLLAHPPMPGVAWLILLDGLDEIFEADRRRQVVDIVGRWWRDPRYRFVIASRPLPDRDLHMLRAIGIPIFEIQGFSDDQLPLLAVRWFHALGVPDAEHAADLFIAQVRQARIAQLARNPLIATISCVVFAGHPDRGLPYNRADLYEELISLFLEKMYGAGHFLGSIRERVRPYGPQAVMAAETLAGELRSLMQDLAISRFTGPGLDLRAQAGQLAIRYRPSGVPLNSWNDLVAELLVQSGLISMRADDLAFTHETITEYLAACARTTPPRPGRVGGRERWQLVTRAGSNESYPLFVAALLRRRGIDLTRRPPALLQMRKLLHARLVAALVHDGCERELHPDVVAAATERLTAIATSKTSGIPFVLRRGIWGQDDDCVIAAKALTLIDKDRGLELLFTLAADPTVPSFSIFDVLAEVMVMEDVTEIDSARGLSVLYRYASAPSPAGVEREEASFNRVMIADLILDRDAERGKELLTTLAQDPSMDLTDRVDCVERLVDIDRRAAIVALVSIITSSRLPDALKTYSYLRGLDRPAAVAALAHVATDPARSGYSRAMASMVLYREARPEGLRAFRALSRDRDAPGFYRVYQFPGFGDHEERKNRLLALSSDTTVSAAWRAFAAEELSGHDRKTGIDALRAIQQDVSVGRRKRKELGMRAFVLERFPAPPGLLAGAWEPIARLMHAENLAPDAGSIPQPVDRYLLPHERCIGIRRTHPAPLLASLSFALCGLVAAIVLSALFPQARALAAIWAVWGLVLLNLVWRTAAWSMEYLVLTDTRLMYTSGLLIRRVSMMPLGAIADMQFERPLFGLMFNYGTFSMASAGRTTGMRLKYMPHPGHLYQDILSLFLTRDA
ncbi:MAG TPA: NACHT domain-containing protein [Streptosporangiaceae bacterium]|nr:NACHT domain-containing protein [Streptosporangiaceae bacterium]